MPFFLIIIGAILIVTGFQNTYSALGTQLSKDFTGKGNFFYWFVAVIIVGSIGYIKPFQGVSRLFLALILIGVFVSNKTASIIQSIPGQIAEGTSQTTSFGNNAQVSTSGSSSGNMFSNIGQDVQLATEVASFL